MIDTMTAVCAVLALSCAWLAWRLVAPYRRSHDALARLCALPAGSNVFLSAHDPMTGDNLSMTLEVDARVIGTIVRMNREGRMRITGVEHFDRTQPRHAQSLLGTLAVLDLEIAERDALKRDALHRDFTAVDALMRQADHGRLHRMADACDMVGALALRGDRSRTLAMSTKDFEALEALAQTA